MDLPSWVGAQEKLSYQGDFQCYQGRSMDNRVAFFLFHDEEAKEQCWNCAVEKKEHETSLSQGAVRPFPELFPKIETSWIQIPEGISLNAVKDEERSFSLLLPGYQSNFNLTN